MDYLYFDYQSSGLILHGSPYQNLTKVNSKNSQYNKKIFGTYSFTRALRYIASLENGGTGSYKYKEIRIILNSHPINLVNESGSIYILDNKSFLPDEHKGKQHDWIYSTTEECTVLAEIKITNVLITWNSFGIYSADEAKSTVLLKTKNPKEIINEIIQNNLNLANHN